MEKYLNMMLISVFYLTFSADCWRGRGIRSAFRYFFKKLTGWLQDGYNFLIYCDYLPESFNFTKKAICEQIIIIKILKF